MEAGWRHQGVEMNEHRVPRVSISKDHTGKVAFNLRPPRAEAITYNLSQAGASRRLLKLLLAPSQIVCFVSSSFQYDFVLYNIINPVVR